MSRWNLVYKGVEILTPEEWNRVVDAFEELDKRSPLEFKGGLATFTGDGTTTTFTITHGLETTPIVVLVGKQTSGLPDIDYWTADTTNIYVTFKTAPASGVSVGLWWLAMRW